MALALFKDFLNDFFWLTGLHQFWFYVAHLKTVLKAFSTNLGSEEPIIGFIKGRGLFLAY